MNRAGEWRVAAVPTAYGVVDDGATVRHVRVPSSGLSLEKLKRAVLAAYEDQYSPDQIKLFTRAYDDDPSVIRERGVVKALSYDPDWADLRAGDTTGVAGTVLLVVSPLDEAESELLVLPAAHSPPHVVMRQHAVPPSGTSAASSAAFSVVRALADRDTTLFDPLPLPAHVDDWLAQFREAPQSVADLMRMDSRVAPSGARHTIYLQPLVLPDRTDATRTEEERLFRGLHGFLCAFFHGTSVRLAEAATLSIDKARRRASVFGKPVHWRDLVPANGQLMPHGQLSAPHLLKALKPRPSRGGGGGKRRGGGGSDGGGGDGGRSGRSGGSGGTLPSDGFCVLGVTMADLFCGDDDVFTGGLACLTSRAGLFSFYRYVDDSPTGGAKSGGGTKSGGGATSGGGAKSGGDGSAKINEGVRLLRACKTAAHEITHMFGIGHCLYRHCLMNGCGHLKEDFAAYAPDRPSPTPWPPPNPMATALKRSVETAQDRRTTYDCGATYHLPNQNRGATP